MWVVIAILSIWMIIALKESTKETNYYDDPNGSDQPLVRFNFFTFNTRKNKLRAYIYTGLELMRKDRGDLRNQQNLFLTLLCLRFQTHDRHAITKMYLKIMRHFNHVDLESVYAWFNKYGTADEKENLIHSLSSLAYHNDHVSTAEFKYLYTTSERIGLGIEQVRSIIATHQARLEAKLNQASQTTRTSSDTKRRQKIHLLGLAGKPTQEAIKKAYRDLAKKYHPDRFHNSSNDDKEQAHERFIAIKNAYDYLMRDF
jgi:DnaJ-domain-containing protein 1